MKTAIFTCKSDTWCQGNACPIGLYIADLHIQLLAKCKHV